MIGESQVAETQARWTVPASIRQLLSRPKTTYLFLAAYSVVLLCLLGYQRLWIDEITQLMSTRSGTLEHIGELTRSGIGSVPLGWLPQLGVIRLMGYSVAAARLPSAIAALGSCFTMYYIARELGMRYPILPVAILAALPLQFRYALEARPYSQGLFVGLLATYLFLLLTRRQGPLVIGSYALVSILGIYSQPFVSAVFCSHFLWACTQGRTHRRLQLVSGSVVLLMAVTFLPWYVYAAPLWTESIRAGGLNFALSWKTPLMLLKEISGAGYVGGCVLVVAAALSRKNVFFSAADRTLLTYCTIFPVIFVLAVDASFGYFLAIRQMIMILPSLTLLACFGVPPPPRGSRLARTVAAGLIAYLGFLAVSDVRWLRKPREDWPAASEAVDYLSAKYSACTVYVPPTSSAIFHFFAPDLVSRGCPSGTETAKPIVVTTSPYASPEEITAGLNLFQTKRIVQALTVGKTQITVAR